MAGDNIDLSIVIPAHGEERRIGKTLDELSDFLRRNSYFERLNVEVVVAVNEVGDKTTDVARKKSKLFNNLQVLSGDRVGKGRNVRYGMLQARGQYRLFMDADLATPLPHLQEFYEACQQADVVIGTRNLLTYRHKWLHGVFAYIGNAMYRFTGGAQVEDTQCGFKIFTADATKRCFERLTIMDWGFDMEVMAIVRAQKLQMKAIRIDDWHHEPHSTHHESATGIALRTVKQHIRILVRSARGAYR
jgi:dolichyl-phosphate beta-glucosyltransferase